MPEATKDDHIRVLAQELIDDIESSRINNHGIVLKCYRLAILDENSEMTEWMRFEKWGYPDQLDELPAALERAKRTGRIIQTPPMRLLGSLDNQDQAIDNFRIKLQTETNGAIITAITTNIGLCQNVINSVRDQIHFYATLVFISKSFQKVNTDIFASYKSDVDRLLTERCGDVIAKIPSIVDRLTAGDREAISHALTSCRRVIDSFADAVYPPREPIIDDNGREILLGNQQTKNRINEYVKEQCASSSRRSKIRQSLSNLYERVSTGVHADVTLDEAKSLFLETYILIGEVIRL